MLFLKFSFSLKGQQVITVTREIFQLQPHQLLQLNNCTFGREDLGRHHPFICRQCYLLGKKKSQRAEHLSQLWFPDQLRTYVTDITLLTAGKPEWRCLQWVINHSWAMRGEMVEQQTPRNISEHLPPLQLTFKSSLQQNISPLTFLLRYDQAGTGWTGMC